MEKDEYPGLSMGWFLPTKIVYTNSPQMFARAQPDMGVTSSATRQICR